MHRRPKESRAAEINPFSVIHAEVQHSLPDSSYLLFDSTWYHQQCSQADRMKNPENDI